MLRTTPTPPKTPILPFLCDYCGDLGISRFDKDRPIPVCDHCRKSGAVEELTPHQGPQPRKLRMAI